MEEKGWLIERKGVQTPQWLELHGSRYIWTIYSIDALRFARFEDAAKFAEYVGLSMGTIHPTEHAWG